MARFHGVRRRGERHGADTVASGSRRRRHERADGAGGGAEQRGRITVRRARDSDGVAHQLEVGRDRLRLARPPAARSVRGRLGVEVEEVDHQLGARHAVDRAVVHLGDDADVAVGQALDHVELPQRAVRSSGVLAICAGQLGQLLVAAGGGDADAADVVVEVEVGVLDPDRVVEPERHLHHPAPEGGGTRSRRADELLHLVERVPPRASSRDRRSPSSPRACACSASPGTGTPRPGRTIAPLRSSPDPRTGERAHRKDATIREHLPARRTVCRPARARNRSRRGSRGR